MASDFTCVLCSSMVALTFDNDSPGSIFGFGWAGSGVGAGMIAGIYPLCTKGLVSPTQKECRIPDPSWSVSYFSHLCPRHPKTFF